MRFLIIISAALGLFFSCSNKTDSNENIGLYRYSSNVIPWRMDVPEDWVMVKTEDQNGLQDSLKSEVISDFTAGFQKDEYNMFQFTIEPFKEDFEGEWIRNNAAVKKLLYDFYVQEGVKIDTTSSKQENINGLNFRVFSAKLFNSEDSLILNQEFYSTLYNEYDFSVCLTYNNSKYGNQLNRMLRNSSFE